MNNGGKIIHNRKIDITTYEGAHDSVIVEGILHDERLVETYRPTGDKHPPGTVHHMIIRMEIKGPKLIIEDIEVEMPTIPYEACLETLNTLNQLKGMPIVSGFTAKVKIWLAGEKGAAICCRYSLRWLPQRFRGPGVPLSRNQLRKKCIWIWLLIE
jgi:hypothetical protein